MGTSVMKTSIGILLLITLVQAQYFNAKKLKSSLSDMAEKMQLSVSNTNLSDGIDRNVADTSNIKLKEFEDHAELQAVEESPKNLSSPTIEPQESSSETENPEVTVSPTDNPHETTLSPTEKPSISLEKEKSENISSVPTPKLVVTNATNNESEKMGLATTQPEPLPTPVPVQLNPGITTEDPECETEEDAKSTSLPKKYIVPRKGVKYCKPSVTGRKEANPSFMKNANSSFGTNVTTETDTGASVMESGDTVDKSMATNLNKLATGDKKKSFKPKLTEADMNLDASSKSPFLTNVSSSATTPSTVPSPRPVDTEPVKPPTVNPPSTEGYSASHKPTAATDSLGSKKDPDSEDNTSYYPAVVGIVLLVGILVTVIVVGYRRLQDVWMRRHYARMDFLIDGMYDV